VSGEFFEPPPPPAEPPSRATPIPPWFGPPSGSLPGVVGLELVLARTPALAVCVTRVSAYATGFELDVLTFGSSEAGEELDHPFFMRRRGPRGARDEGSLRFGVQFSDGGKATNMGGPRPLRFEEQPQGPVLTGHGGGGGGSRWSQQFWVWPLPPPGQLALVCEWPAVSIPLTRHEIDAQLILDAAGRAQEIFAPGPQGGGRWSSYAPLAPVVRIGESER